MLGRARFVKVFVFPTVQSKSRKSATSSTKQLGWLAYWIRSSSGAQEFELDKTTDGRPCSTENLMKVWQTTRTLYTVSDFVTWYKEGSLILNPDFQRRSVWKPGAKSFLIDTIMRGLPIPIILIRELATD